MGGKASKEKRSKFGKKKTKKASKERQQSECEYAVVDTVEQRVQIEEAAKDSNAEPGEEIAPRKSDIELETALESDTDLVTSAEGEENKDEDETGSYLVTQEGHLQMEESDEDYLREDISDEEETDVGERRGPNLRMRRLISSCRYDELQRQMFQ